VTELLERGTLVDVALVALAVELVLLVALARRGRGRLGPLDVLGQLLAGGLLLGALRCALTGAHPLWILALLTASFPAHLYDLRRRLRSR
jgi:hypothetical protein